MTDAQKFESFLNNIKVDSHEQIDKRYREITKALNKYFRNTESETANSFMIGSYGRYTGIKNISDLDMIYVVPSSLKDKYRGKPYDLLVDTKNAIGNHYSSTFKKVDQCIVSVQFQNFTFEVQPAFEEEGDDDGPYYKYPFTYEGKNWYIVKPKQEQAAIRNFKTKNLRLLCKMIRAWKNNSGQKIGGLLIDTLAYNFLNSTTTYDKGGVGSFGYMVRDFFSYMYNQPDQSYYLAPGSKQHVNVRKRFQRKAEQAYNICVEALSEADSTKSCKLWQKVFGRFFPMPEIKEFADKAYNNTEQFVEDIYPIDILYAAKVDAMVTQNGWMPHKLSQMLLEHIHLVPGRKMVFEVETDTPEPYDVKWKVRNVGPVAERRNCIRGAIIDSNSGLNKRKESADFDGPHFVECYIVKNGVVVARGRIDVPIKESML